MPCLTHWHIWLCHMEVGRTLVLSPSTYKMLDAQENCRNRPVLWGAGVQCLALSGVDECKSGEPRLEFYRAVYHVFV
jgi:hypothetical protein